MAGKARQPGGRWREVHSPVAFREVFRYRKAGRTRVYGLKAVDGDRSELWVVSAGERTRRKSRKLVTFENGEDPRDFLRDIERELRAGAWSEG